MGQMGEQMVRAKHLASHLKHLEMSIGSSLVHHTIRKSLANAAGGGGSRVIRICLPHVIMEPSGQTNKTDRRGAMSTKGFRVQPSFCVFDFTLVVQRSERQGIKNGHSDITTRVNFDENNFISRTASIQ